MHVRPGPSLAATQLATVSATSRVPRVARVAAHGCEAICKSHQTIAALLGPLGSERLERSLRQVCAVRKLEHAAGGGGGVDELMFSTWTARESHEHPNRYKHV